ncbi:hypothetical protein FAF44_34700 [Nonomuraea sp. MG754425]|uniref:hypothetical protein n=1 Tax=Nonomuraea sp. MG754425 TaxID=2570319 RepID=UPI001F1F2011|nr:hypothetical protein [Nonomuraea sp. MG754425]MCF6473500.1 hypothetical protein [Nonomuraea sp. MG754425]
MPFLNTGTRTSAAPDSGRSQSVMPEAATSGSTCSQGSALLPGSETVGGVGRLLMSGSGEVVGGDEGARA